MTGATNGLVTGSISISMRSTYEYVCICCSFSAWRSFHETPSGEEDPTIVVYRRGKELPQDFEPFNIDRFLAEKLLKELDIDPKFAIF